MTIEIFCVILGLIQGVLAYLNKRSNWLVYAAQMGALIGFSATNSLWGDTVQNSIYLVICLYSYFYLWNKSGGFEKVSTVSWMSRGIWVLVTAVATFCIGEFLATTSDPLPYVDAFTTVTTFVALILMSYHKIECWIVWLINDIAYMYQYYALPDQAVYLMGLYIVWTALAVFSFINWLKIYRNNKSGTDFEVE